MWIVNQNDNSVTELSSLDGSLIATYSVGSFPFWIAYDYLDSMWVTNTQDGTVTKIKLDGSVKTTLNGFTSPNGITSDGTNMWITSLDNTLKKYDRNGAMINSFATGVAPAQVAFFGGFIWVSNYNDNNVKKYDLLGNLIITIPVGVNPFGLASDSVNMWVCNYGSMSVTKIDIINNVVIATYTVSLHPYAIAYDYNGHMWITQTDSFTVTVVNAVDGSVANTLPAPFPTGIAYDLNNQYMWVVNTATNTATKEK